MTNKLTAGMIIVCALWILWAKQAQADITLAWDVNPEPSVVSYTLHVGTNSGSYQDSYVVTNGTTQTLTNLLPGVPYFAAVSASTTNTTSGLSDEITWVTPIKPTGLRITPTIETSYSPLGPWRDYAEQPWRGVIITNSLEVAYYRLRMAIDQPGSVTIKP